MDYEEALRKAMACLRLAKSSNEAEAALAAAKAQEIITRYNLDVTDANYESQSTLKDQEPIQDYGNNDPIDTVDRSERGWALRLLSVVARTNGCRCYQGVNVDGKGGKRLMVVGRPSDVQTVRYLYGFFKNEVDRLCELNTRGNSGTYKSHYRLGVVDAVTEKLRSQRTQTEQALKTEHANNSAALIKVNNALVKQKERDDQVEKALLKFLYGSEDPKSRRSGHASGYAKTFTGGREHGRRDGASIRHGARGGLTSGAKQLVH